MENVLSSVTVTNLYFNGCFIVSDTHVNNSLSSSIQLESLELMVCMLQVMWQGGLSSLSI